MYSKFLWVFLWISYGESPDQTHQASSLRRAISIPRAGWKNSAVHMAILVKAIMQVSQGSEQLDQNRYTSKNLPEVLSPESTPRLASRACPRFTFIAHLRMGDGGLANKNIGTFWNHHEPLTKVRCDTSRVPFRSIPVGDVLRYSW